MFNWKAHPFFPTNLQEQSVILKCHFDQFDQLELQKHANLMAAVQMRKVRSKKTVWTGYLIYFFLSKVRLSQKNNEI